MQICRQSTDTNISYTVCYSFKIFVPQKRNLSGSNAGECRLPFKIFLCSMLDYFPSDHVLLFMQSRTYAACSASMKQLISDNIYKKRRIKNSRSVFQRLSKEKDGKIFVPSSLFGNHNYKCSGGKHCKI